MHARLGCVYTNRELQQFNVIYLCNFLKQIYDIEMSQIHVRVDAPLPQGQLVLETNNLFLVPMQFTPTKPLLKLEMERVL